MRQITQDIINAFINGNERHIDNSSTYQDGHGDFCLSLFGNVIAKKVNGLYSINFCGWKSRTTLERLNGLLTNLGTSLKLIKRKGEIFVYNSDNGLYSMVDTSKWISFKELELGDGYNNLFPVDAWTSRYYGLHGEKTPANKNTVYSI